MFKNKMKNYFISEVLKSYFFTLTVLSLLIWFTQAARLLNMITESGVSIEVYTLYIFFLLPKVISQLMIISLLISLFLNITKFNNNKELEIYWLSGISKQKISNLIIKISFFLSLLAFIFYSYLAPLSGLKSREILANSEFSLINTLVKKNNFNSPLKNLTIFVNKNDNKGNLEKIYIFENKKTIISKKGRVLNIDQKNYLELTDGIIHEKNSNNDISTISFEKTLYDFTKFKTQVITTPKVQERDFAWLISEYFKTSNPNILYEIHKRIFKPLFIPFISIICCFALYGNNEKMNLNKSRIIIFSLSTLLIIFIEILLNLSVVNIFFKYFLYFLPFLGCLISFLCLKKYLLNENK